MSQVIGTCGICGGPVGYSDTWMSTLPQTPRCMTCGAEPVEPHGPTIPMKPKSPKGYQSLGAKPAWAHDSAARAFMEQHECVRVTREIMGIGRATIDVCSICGRVQP